MLEHPCHSLLAGSFVCSLLMALMCIFFLLAVFEKFTASFWGSVSVSLLCSLGGELCSGLSTVVTLSHQAGDVLPALALHFSLLSQQPKFM